MKTEENQNARYFMYARKSTNTEGKQVTSIEDQLAVLKDYAKNRGLTVVDTLIEKHSAKEGGKRPVFKQMEITGKNLVESLRRLFKNDEKSRADHWQLD
ncbi:hypothetical protein FACS1894125_7460 [Actinomycetota bacterium]|nr:hypothetical protein FACS1894125_7460 [Actinomycetota bacterium]